jgi:hypothetical protein
MNGQYDVTEASAQIDFSPSYELAGGSMSQPLDGISTTGTMAQTSWTLRALESKSSTDDIRVVASGKVNGSSRSYASYTDLIGGYGVGGTPPFQPTSRTWAHDSIGVSQTSSQWYLAEGSTAGGMETFVLVQNPNSSSANVKLTYMTDQGEVPGPSVSIPANSRMTFNVSSTVPDTWQVSTYVSSDKPVIAERAMYGNGRTWAHDSIGVVSPKVLWYLAEGSTGKGFETWILVQNPGNETATVSLKYMTSAGEVAGPVEEIPPHTRKTFNVAATVSDTWEVSTFVSSDKPIIVERAMYGDSI